MPVCANVGAALGARLGQAQTEQQTGYAQDRQSAIFPAVLSDLRCPKFAGELAPCCTHSAWTTRKGWAFQNVRISVSVRRKYREVVETTGRRCIQSGLHPVDVQSSRVTQYRDSAVAGTEAVECPGRGPGVTRGRRGFVGGLMHSNVTTNLATCACVAR
jgi:hypothetical protein